MRSVANQKLTCSATRLLLDDSDSDLKKIYKTSKESRVNAYKINRYAKKLDQSI